MPYGDIRLDGSSVAGIQPLPPDMAANGVPPTWTVYLGCDDVEAVTAAVRVNGGEVLVDATHVGDGAFAVVADPTGAVFGLWDGPGMGDEHETGTFAWAEVVTADLDAAVAFYAANFPDLQRQDTAIGDDRYTVFRAGDDAVFGVVGRSQPHVAPHWMVYVSVEDVDSAVEDVTAHGGDVLVAPHDAPPGRIAVITDPQGAALSIIDPNPDFDLGAS
jgi:predicted enzyme related to lactoylglutathione lyase